MIKDSRDYYTIWFRSGDPLIIRKDQAEYVRMLNYKKITTVTGVSVLVAGGTFLIIIIVSLATAL